MFYSQFILAKKGPLGTIWIAAHLERKLRKNQVADTDIGVSVDSILFPDVPIALRLSSHLLLGVVRIYNRKVNYLFDDCSEALLKVKQAFRSAAVDLPPEESKAPYHSITLPETFELDDFELPDNDIFHGNFVDHHISSRDQITLQDTLDGVTYSTSKFGLDERFGDGDASGLDLDEELFLDKVDASGHVNERSDPQSSVGPMTPLKQDEHPEIRTADSGTRVGDVDDDDDAADLMEYAQAPCTPGLMEEPNLSNVQEVSACDDHMESEYRLRESVMIENAKNNICGDKQEANWSSHTNKNSDAVPEMLPEEYGNQSGGLDIDSSKPQGESPVKANMEHAPIETLSGSKAPFDAVGQDKSVNISLEFADKITGASHVSCMEGLQNEDADKYMNSALPFDDSDQHQGPYETGFEKSACEISGVASNCHQDESFPQNRETQASDELGDPSSSNLDVHEKVASSISPFVRSCNSTMEQPDLISGCAMSADVAVRSDVTDLATSEREETVMIGQACSGADNSEEVLKENHMQEHIDAASNEPDSQVMNVSAHDSLVDNLNNSAEANLHAPEKLLSVPEDLVDQQNKMLAEISPGEFAGLDASDAGSKVISGKKRSFTEIGRSSVLKVKATPRPSEGASTKRTRSAPRTGAPKRKVPMDDTMVLHGDMIRQQLTNSGDIRRVRKKAPCTQSEISLIQKQYLEDKFFLEPLFTGMSIQLVSLHCQIWDLSGIQVCNSNPNDSSLENVADMRLSSENVPSENNQYAYPETTAAPILCPDDAKKDDSLTTAAEPHSASQNAENCESLDLISDKDSGRHNVAEQSGVRITNELSSDRDSEMAKFSESPLLTNNGINEVHEINVEINTCDEQIKTSNDVEADASQQEPFLDVNGHAFGPSATIDQMNPTTETCETFTNADTSAGLPEQEKNAPSVELHSAKRDADNGQAISEDVLIARDGDVNSVFETDPMMRDDVLLEAAQESATLELLSDSKQGQLEFDEHNEMHSAALGGNFEYSSYTAHQEDVFMENGRSLDHHFMMGAESSGFHLHDQEDWNYSAAGNDTEFLNVDDDDLNEMADDHIPDDEEARFIENTGWSSRTRAVSKYLQTVFVKEAEQGRKSLPLESLLIGKSRKEASRMFFETLVLKTRDYVHVEQQNPFDGIVIKPRTRLMKSDF
ncbi:sister chromatid cohesion 1 protein 4 [Perilla frutescens var. hirtella]|uniref:Sister chromatid cohesion 1 protein 4 n=1 Tax=Perilla frutescens var. hirtella TaxID=608512 RepID=A0AAD4IU90_PERFH|nr:sister chromatid cohesion 1 protein 4 [Perilla frutescens var. hirtella]